jgi:hypothetical protein
LGEKKHMFIVVADLREREAIDFVFMDSEGEEHRALPIPFEEDNSF